MDAIAWYGGNSGVSYEGAWDCLGWSETQKPSEKCGTHPVAGKAANGFELYDMLGNVWEWTWDWFGEYSSSLESDPRGPAEGSPRVLRGGSWYDNARYCRSAYRGRNAPGTRSASVGFRLVRTAP